MIKRWFVTGTDTEVGKTLTSVALLQAAAQLGYRCAGYKPVASGSVMTKEGLRNEDALALQMNSNVMLDYDEVNRYTFAPATAPHIVSAQQFQPIEFSHLSSGLRHLESCADWLVIEGAGGWFTPLSEQKTFADWVCLERLAVILVVGMKLGCINHAMLTAQAIQSSGLCLAGWVANCIIKPGQYHQAYFNSLQRLLPAPCLGEIPYTPYYNPCELGQYLDINRL